MRDANYYIIKQKSKENGQKLLKFWPPFLRQAQDRRELRNKRTYYSPATSSAETREINVPNKILSYLQQGDTMFLGHPRGACHNCR